MKKLLCAVLAVLLLTGCTVSKPTITSSPTTAPTKATTPPPPEPELPKSAEIEILSCRFKEQVLPVDHETYFGWFPMEYGKIHIDLTLRVQNTGEAPLGKDDLSAYFSYDGQRIDMQLEVEENAWNFANEDRTVHPGQTRTVHLFYNADSAITESDITVHYTFLGESGEIAVEQAVQPVLEDKTELRISDTVNWGETGTVQVMDCLITSYLRPTGKNAQKYHSPEGYDYFVMIIKVDSESEIEPDLLDAYVMAGQEPDFVDISVESGDHMTLIPLAEAEAPQAGEERILHLWVEIPSDMPSSVLVMRLNVDTTAYYCYPLS